MAEPDDIDKLLREIDAMNGVQRRPGAAPPTPASPPASGRGRGAWSGACAVGGLLVGGAAGSVLWFLPYVSPGSTAVGAVIGAAAAGLLSGPPSWFRR